jgi:hypothetical protein
MGMDVYGIKPTSKVGEYFRRNVWGWHPLWEYCLDLHPDIAGKVKNGHSNDGDGLGLVNAKKLAKKLDNDVKNGVAKKYIDDRNKRIADLSQQLCWLCEGKATLNKITLNAVDESSSTKTSNQCHVCNGTGFGDDWEKNYYLELEDIVEFSKFLEASGGFQIW